MRRLAVGSNTGCDERLPTFTGTYRDTFGSQERGVGPMPASRLRVWTSRPRHILHWMLGDLTSSGNYRFAAMTQPNVSQFVLGRSLS